METITHLLSFESLIAILSLTLMEVVLGIDNIIFVSIIASKLEKSRRKKATNIGLVIAIVPRIILLFLISLIIQLTKPLFQWQIPLLGYTFQPSGRDLILLTGGLFLIYKATIEIHQKLQGYEESIRTGSSSSNILDVVVQIALINIVFSFDSILTAIGMVDASKPQNLWIMIISIVLSMVVMIFFAMPVNNFVSHNPTVKMLALAFLVMIGTVLIMEGLQQKISKGYVYFAMFFALFVEILNMRMLKKAQAVRLRMCYVEENENSSAEARLIDTEMVRKHLEVKHLKNKRHS